MIRDVYVFNMPLPSGFPINAVTTCMTDVISEVPRISMKWWDEIGVKVTKPSLVTVQGVFGSPVVLATQGNRNEQGRDRIMMLEPTQNIWLAIADYTIIDEISEVSGYLRYPTLFTGRIRLDDSAEVKNNYSLFSAFAIKSKTFANAVASQNNLGRIPFLSLPLPSVEGMAPYFSDLLELPVVRYDDQGNPVKWDLINISATVYALSMSGPVTYSGPFHTFIRDYETEVTPLQDVPYNDAAHASYSWIAAGRRVSPTGKKQSDYETPALILLSDNLSKIVVS